MIAPTWKAIMFKYGWWLCININPSKRKLPSAHPDDLGERHESCSCVLVQLALSDVALLHARMLTLWVKTTREKTTDHSAARQAT